MLIIKVLIFVTYVVVCLGLIFLVLLQQSKGGGLAGAFGGGGGGETMFGYTSMQKIGRWTLYLAIAFIVLSFLIANFHYEQKSQSILDLDTPPVQGLAPAVEDQPQGQQPPAPPEDAQPEAAQLPATQ